MSDLKTRDLSYAAGIFYIVNLVYFFIYLLPKIGNGITEKCINLYTCKRYLRTTWLGYSRDIGDGQWHEFRGSLWLLWVYIYEDTYV